VSSSPQEDEAIRRKRPPVQRVGRPSAFARSRARRARPALPDRVRFARRPGRPRMLLRLLAVRQRMAPPDAHTGTRLRAAGAEAEATSTLRRDTHCLLGPSRGTLIQVRSASAHATRGFHVREDRALGAGGHDRHRKPGDVDVCSASAAPPFLDRQHSHDVLGSHEPPVAERHHADVSSSHILFLAHIQMIANACSIYPRIA
jgi:hypothetical protein